MRFYIFLFLLLPIFSQLKAQPPSFIIKGKVIDVNNQGIEFAQVSLAPFGKVQFTNNKGSFAIELNDKRIPDSLSLTFSSIGKRSLTIILGPANLKDFLMIKLYDSSLSLAEIVVTETRQSKNSNSSILFGREAIEQVQAFSLADVLNNLPGKNTIPPSLQNPQNITLRSDANGTMHHLNNALGTSIIIDGLQQSNNANMQSRSVSKFGLSGAVLGSHKYGDFDVTFGGIDLRDIPADNIESIEVISGVAPAQYGDLTDGAVIINRQAGKTNYQFNTRINGASSNYSITKGFALGEKRGALNTNFNYLISNQDPSDPIKSYARIGGGLMWTVNLSEKIKNTLSVDYSAKIDDVKQDPDDGTEQKSYSKARKLSFSNRSSIRFEHHLFKSLNFNIGYSYGYQETYNQWFFNSAPKAVADRDTTGIYEGNYTPGTYLAVEHVIGEPENVNGNISLNSEVSTGDISHQLSLGANIYYAANKGEGILVDPTLPRWANQGYQNERPYSFESLPDVLNFGVYLQDQFKFDLFNKTITANPGLRLDVQNKQATIQPRVNIGYAIAKDLKLSLAYGVSTKAPTLAHRYPTPTYIDLLLLNEYNGKAIESMALFFTDKIIADNSSLQSSKTQQAEIGLSYAKKGFSSSVFTFYKKSSNGFSSNSVWKNYVLPKFETVQNPGSKPAIIDNGETKQYLVSYHIVGNDISSINTGIEWYFSTPKINKIQTSFSFNSSFFYTLSKSASETITKTSDANIALNKKAWFGVYPAKEQVNWSLMSKLNTITHLPKLGFVVNLMLDIFWQDKTQSKAINYAPVAYLDKEMNRYPITNYNDTNPEYGHLGLSTAASTDAGLPYVYANTSIRVSKEINQTFRFSVNAYNFLNIRHRYENPKTNDIITLVYPVSVGAELSIKF